MIIITAVTYKNHFSQDAKTLIWIHEDNLINLRLVSLSLSFSLSLSLSLFLLISFFAFNIQDSLFVSYFFILFLIKTPRHILFSQLPFQSFLYWLLIYSCTYCFYSFHIPKCFNLKFVETVYLFVIVFLSVLVFSLLSFSVNFLYYCYVASVFLTGMKGGGGEQEIQLCWTSYLLTFDYFSVTAWTKDVIPIY